MITRDLTITVRSSAGQDLPVEELAVDLGSRMVARDQAALLLSVAAEIEHALMVQYLYAAYSIRTDQEDHAARGTAIGIAGRILQIAREEMGHLITVQNLLHLIGAPPRFERQHSPFESELYPFRFKLEALSSGVLAKYITAEGPAKRPEEMDDATWARVQSIAAEARAANDGRPIRHVGAIYAALISLFEDPARGIQNDDFFTASAPLQAAYDDWGYNPGGALDDTRQVLVSTFISQDLAELRRGAVEALRTISEQGEGFGLAPDSHFERFLEIYDDFNRIGSVVVLPVSTNPSVLRPEPNKAWEEMDLIEAVTIAQAEAGYIATRRTRRWAHLLNLEYRLLLETLAHYLRLPGERYIAGGDRLGDRTPRGYLLLWAFDAMRHIKKIAGKLVRLPLTEDPDDHRMAGPPFQLPYSLVLPDDERARWRTHLDVIRASRTVLEELRAAGDGGDAGDPFLEDLAKAYEVAIEILKAFVAGADVPDQLRPADFKKVVQVLEEAVRGFSINVHENFWTGKTRDEFTAMHMFNGPILASDPNDNCRLVAAESDLVRRIRDRGNRTANMPRFRPAVPAPRFEYISQWINRQAPDNKPPGEVGLAHERSPNPESVGSLAPEMTRLVLQQLDYARDIRPLFRPFDRAFLKRLDSIDLDDEADVRRHATDLATRLGSGTLPYDANWSPEKVARFKTWAMQVSGSQ
jgi:rubrerythrin